MDGAKEANTRSIHVEFQAAASWIMTTPAAANLRNDVKLEVGSL